MSDRLFLASFEDEGKFLAALERVRAEGLVIEDAFMPYAVHGFEEAMGLQPSWLGRATLVFAVVGAAGSLLFQYWTSAVDWALNVGGKPWNSLPTFIPVSFEVTVLFAGLGTVATLLWSRRLLPGRKSRQPFPQVTDNRFVICLREEPAGGRHFDTARVTALCRDLGAVETGEQEMEARP